MTVRRALRADVRNPLVALPSFSALAAVGEPEAAIVWSLLIELRDEARRRASASWQRRKPPMAAYWAVVAVYAGHAARAFRPPRQR